MSTHDTREVAGVRSDDAAGMRPAAVAAGDDPLDRLVAGRPGEVVLDRDLPGAGRLSVTVLDPDADLDVVHAWVTQPRAAFWGLGHLSRAELRETYAFVDSLPTHHAFLVRWDGEPVALLQTYAPEHDPLGECYDVAPGDVGVHFLLGARGPRGTDLWAVLGVVLHAVVVDRPGVRRVVVEPDVRNAAARARVLAQGFVLGPEVRVGGKTAQLAFLDADVARATADRAARRLARPAHRDGDALAR